MIRSLTQFVKEAIFDINKFKTSTQNWEDSLAIYFIPRYIFGDSLYYIPATEPISSNLQDYMKNQCDLIDEEKLDGQSYCQVYQDENNATLIFINDEKHKQVGWLFDENLNINKIQ